MGRKHSQEQAFTRFVKETEPRLSYALAAAYGPEVGAEATAGALAFAWEHWERIERMGNPVGYLYRVGQSRSRRYRRPRTLFPCVWTADLMGISRSTLRTHAERGLDHLRAAMEVRIDA